MRLKKDWYERATAKLLLAAGANLLFLFLLLKVFTPRYEINDDLFISMFIDGQMANKSRYILFCNYFLAAILEWLYDLTSNAYPLYSYFQYGLLFLSFTGISYILLRRCDFFVAVAAAACLLGAFAADCYIGLTYTKTAGVGVTAGVLLMLFARSERESAREAPGKRESRGCLIAGTALCLASCALRAESFVTGLALLFPVGLYEMIGNVRNSGQKKFRAAAVYFRPFLIMLLLAAGLYGGDALMWKESPYKEYKDFMLEARDIPDYHKDLNRYELMPAVYEALNISPEVLDMASRSYQGFDDMEIWTTEICRQVTKARDKLQLNPGLGAVLKTYAGCWTKFLEYGFIWGVFGLGLLWLIFAKKDRGRICVLAGQLLIFSCVYLVLIWMERYLVNRVDVSLFMALAMGMLWQITESKPGRWRQGLCLLLALLAVPMCGYQFRQNLSNNQEYQRSFDYSKWQIQRLIEDKHLFLVGTSALNLYLYSPLEPMPEGYRDSLYFSGGWVVRHPQVMALLAEYGLENPYRDAVNNEQVYLIPNDINTTIKYIHDYYDSKARAEIVQDLSNELGITIYRIVS